MRRLRTARMFLSLATLGACSSGGDEHAGQSCTAPANCYPSLSTPPKGEIMCLTRVEGGYCTHLCQVDSDCCAVDGECKTAVRQVCSPFESTGQRMCFLSCETDVLGGTDPNVYCQDNAHKAFICRSTGGGAQNRKVCVPNG